MTATARVIALLWPLFLFVITWSIAISFAESIFNLFNDRTSLVKSFFSSLPILLALSMLGGIIGYVSGLSREPVIGAVIPALLSLVAAIAVLVVGKNSETQALVGKMILALSVTFMFGISVGSHRREEFYIRQQQARLSVILDIDFQRELAVREALIRRMRQKLQLPTAPIAVDQPKFDKD